MQKVSFREKIGYGIGAVGLDLSYGLFYSYLSIYLTNVMGIKSLFLLILAPIARLWDGINDPMMGTLVDMTNTKMGKYRPWIIIGAVCNAVVLCLLFNNPGFDYGSVGLYIYIALLYVFWGMTNTLADIPYWSMVPSFSSEEKERNAVSTIARTFSGLGQGIIIIFTPYALKLLGDGTNEDVNAQGFGRWAMIAAVLLVFFAVCCVLSTKEKNVVMGQKEKFSLKNSVKTIKSNDQLLVFMLFAMISNAGYYMTSGISGYYFTVICGDIALQSIFNMFGAVGSIVGLLVIPVCSSAFKMTNRQTYKTSLIMAVVGYVGMFAAGTFFNKNVYIMGAFYFVTSLGIASMFVNQTVMLADVVDYGEFHTGKRSESLTFSMKGFLQKMAYTVQCIIMYGLFLATGYVVGQDKVQSAAAQGAISAMMYIIPPVLIIISLIIFSKKYKIYGEYKTEVLNFINEKRENEHK